MLAVLLSRAELNVGLDAFYMLCFFVVTFMITLLWSCGGLWTRADANEAPTKPMERSAPSMRKMPSSVSKPAEHSPRTVATQLVGNRLNVDQAKLAAQKIVQLAPYVNGPRRQVLDLNGLWPLFDMAVPPAVQASEVDTLTRKLRLRLNRYRLLLHPDKNAHPQAQRSFTFLEECHQRLADSLRKPMAETRQQRRCREEREFQQEQECRARREREQKAVQERIQKEEESDFRKAKADENERVRLEAMQRDKELRIKKHIEGNMLPRFPDVATGLSGIFARTCACVSSVIPSDEEPRSGTPLGTLSGRLLSATDLPPAGLLFQSSRTYAVANMGVQTFQSPRVVASCNPSWNCSFRFDVYSIKSAFCVTVFREGWLEDQPLGKVEIPLLDLNEWSGCAIGRVLQPADCTHGPTMVLELKAVLEWF